MSESRPKSSAISEAKAAIRWAASEYDGSICMTSAFGLNGVALIHLVHDLGLLGSVPVVFVDTGAMFKETFETRDGLTARYPDLVVFTVHPAGELSSRPGPRDDDCCEMRKVAPMRRALAVLKPKALLTGRGRFQAVTRRELLVVEEDRDPVRVNPLATWTQPEVERYVRTNDVPYNPLYDQGYYSVGCWPCTRPVDNGEDVREGRWDGLGRVECGIWR